MNLEMGLKRDSNLTYLDQEFLYVPLMGHLGGADLSDRIVLCIL